MIEGTDHSIGRHPLQVNSAATALMVHGRDDGGLLGAGWFRLIALSPYWKTMFSTRSAVHSSPSWIGGLIPLNE